MFERIFQWSMRHGAKILFILALVVPVFSVSQILEGGFIATRGMAHNLNSSTPEGMDALLLFQRVLMSLNSAEIPFAGAVIITLLEKYVASKSSGTERND